MKNFTLGMVTCVILLKREFHDFHEFHELHILGNGLEKYTGLYSTNRKQLSIVFSLDISDPMAYTFRCHL